MKIIYNASTESISSSPSLNQCLEIGQPLQNLLWCILIQNCFSLVPLYGDIKQTFLQIHYQRRGSWWNTFSLVDRQWSKLNRNISLYQVNVESCARTIHPEINISNRNWQRNFYLDYAILGGNNMSEGKQLQTSMIKIFREPNLRLHK